MNQFSKFDKIIYYPAAITLAVIAAAYWSAANSFWSPMALLTTVLTLEVWIHPLVSKKGLVLVRILNWLAFSFLLGVLAVGLPWLKSLIQH